MHRSTRPIGLIPTSPAGQYLFCIVASAIVAVLAAAPAIAEDEEYGRTGAYARVGVVGGVDVDRRTNDTATAGGAGFNVWFGSREGPRLAWEIGVEGLLSDGTNDSAWNYGIAGKFYFSEGRLQPYLVFGAGGYTRLRDGEKRRTDWGFRPGLGLDFYLTEKWALTGEGAYVVGVGDLLRQEYASFSLGVLYRF